MEKNRSKQRENNPENIIEAIKAEVEKLCPDGTRAEVFMMEKNNAVVKPAMVIYEPGKGTSPLIYLEPYVREINEGSTIEETARAIYAVHQKNCGVEPAIANQCLTADRIRDKIIYQLINLTKNQSVLAKTPYQVFGEDLAIVFSVLLENNDQGMMTMRINRKHMEHWGMEEEELWKLANRNTPRLLPAELGSFNDVLIALLKEQLMDSGFGSYEETLDLLDTYTKQIKNEEANTPMFILSNRNKTWGASVILYPDVLKTTAEQLGGDLVILPSSIHEVIVMRKENMPEYHDIAEMVGEINQREVLPEEVLSDSVYVYDNEENTVYRVAGNPKA